MPLRFNRLLEPFAGMAAVTIAAAAQDRADSYVVNDVDPSVVNLLRAAVETPAELTTEYAEIWNGQFRFPEGHVKHYYFVRDKFNDGERSAANALYLLARCVKGAVRYDRSGRFNQSPDNRRHGTKPATMAANVRAVSAVLKGRSRFHDLDYRRILDMAEPGDLVYLDPPYQGVSGGRGNRYVNGVDYQEFTGSIELLNEKRVDFLISYDGDRGGKSYGRELPSRLRLRKYRLDAGTSAQATLLGKRETTFESLYVSEGLPKLPQE